MYNVSYTVHKKIKVNKNKKRDAFYPEPNIYTGGRGLISE